MQKRYYSLDVFRGATVALMILVNNPGSWSYIFPPLQHAAWHGCTPTDLVFPFFLFAVGNALAFVMPKLLQLQQKQFLLKVLKRSILIFLIGIFLNWSPFFKWSNNELVFKPWHDVRIMGVLQRIAVCYFLAALMAYYFTINRVLYIAFIILLLNWIITFLANPQDPFSLTGYFGTKLDIALFGEHHLYHGEGGIAFDPEGLVSSIAAVVQVILGYLIGTFIQTKGKNYEMLSKLFVLGIMLLGIGYIWDMVYPINKKIWTSSYTIYTTGLATVIIGVMIYLHELKNTKSIVGNFFDAFGKNPLFIFVLSGFLPRLLGLFRIADHTDENGNIVYLSAFGWFYEHICKNLSTDLRVGSLVYAITLIFFYWLIAYFLDKRKIYIKV